MFHVKRREWDLRYRVVVVGGGHAGCEAALASARMGVKTLMVTINMDKIALMPCNPAIGGIGKGQLVKEIDALGGMMGRIADRASIQLKVLNRSKGPAVQALRAQTDKRLYEDEMKKTILQAEKLDVLQGMASEVLVEDGLVVGIKLEEGVEIGADAVILATGTFLNAHIVVGDKSYPAGRVGEYSAIQLSAGLRRIGMELDRLQTATPPRVDGRTVEYERMIPQPGDDDVQGFSGKEQPILPSMPCYLTYTNRRTHEVVRRYLQLSPIRTGMVSGRGPRFCPSIDRKVINFPEKERHPVFVEPEGWRTREVYLQGLTTSMPAWVQQKIIEATPGLEHARMVRPGYAVMYDFAPPQQLRATLEHKEIGGLFLAGQINGTSGYEEAAAQGIMAGINAARKVMGEAGIVLGRSQAYIGVMIDDLVTKGVEEPYRMFTSRAEFRLILRFDNAGSRLKPIGYRLGLIGEEDMAKEQEMEKGVKKLLEELKKKSISAEQANKILERKGGCKAKEAVRAIELLRRPEVSIEDLLEAVPSMRTRSREELMRVETEVKYEGYIKRQLKEARKVEELEEIPIPWDFDYDQAKGVSYAAREQLKRIRPRTLGQASRISTVTPSDLAIIAICLKKEEEASGAV